MGSRWRQFVEWSAYPRESDEHGELVTQDWLVQNGRDYSRPGHTTEDEEDQSSKDKKKVHQKPWWPRTRRTLLHSAAIPLVFRAMIGGFSIIALTLGAKIYYNTRFIPDGIFQSPCQVLAGSASTTSPLMAITYDAVALIYLFPITYDEFIGQPIGLRAATSKVRLIMLDLVFIVFDSANLSLAFEAVSSTLSEPCEARPDLVMQQIALASVLLVALLAWLMTFTLSIFR